MHQPVTKILEANSYLKIIFVKDCKPIESIDRISKGYMLIRGCYHLLID